MLEKIETVVVGAGQAGLAMSYHLTRLAREHVVLERGRIAERWRSERWDTLTFQFPKWMMQLPGYAYAGADPDGFMHRDGVVEFIGNYARRIAPPVRCGVDTKALHRLASGRLLVATDHSEIEAENVVIATGPYQVPLIPAFGAALSPRLHQVTANRYASADALPSGAALVVGSGSSGYQIADDLLRHGRRVYVSVRSHRRVPRRYRGHDVGWWQERTGAFGRIAAGLAADIRAPLLTGVGGGHDASFRRLEENGACLMGSLIGTTRRKLHFACDLERNLAAADASHDRFTGELDAYILQHEMKVPDRPEPDPRGLRVAAAPDELDVEAAGITSVIWAIGYRYDFGWVRCPVFDACGRPVHRRGVTAVPGVCFLGLPRLHKVRSAFLWGVGEDAAYLARHIATPGPAGDRRSLVP